MRPVIASHQSLRRCITGPVERYEKPALAVLRRLCDLKSFPAGFPLLVQQWLVPNIDATAWYWLTACEETFLGAAQ